MRISQLFVAAGLAIAASAGIPGTGDGAPPSSVALVSSPSSLPTATAVGAHSSTSSELLDPTGDNATVVVVSSHSSSQTTTTSAAGPANHSSTHTTAQSSATPDATLQANATSSKPADATGGAILPQMQGSMAGLLGFCIMSLMLL
ncbi:hypothetical protein IF1G_06020 [Cordyceps javanica]|uniref:Uncharacterized protein n=1 Tax=Cordyceps javanica TaxID=43265 RepID=A0A545VVL0_9HYPO|nr:hypothetical protein IF1G_06020 [Cordyceps javanica]TQW05759.1 hypothetical protein IF2G_06881 [Cordyceps javanica]